MNIYETIERPTLLLDEETARHNIQNMAAKARAAKARFRPHFKPTNRVKSDAGSARKVSNPSPFRLQPWLSGSLRMVGTIF